MEDAVKDKYSASGRSSSKLNRYPLRSATKLKEDMSPLPASIKRGKPPSSVSQSMGVLDLSSKGKSVKPARRLSIPTKATTTPVPKSVGNITPISEVKARRSAVTQEKSDTPVSRSSNRKKFTVLSSASYWLNQIKLSESAAKHSISLGLFKLAFDAGCEPFQKVREELKSYARRHNLAEFGDTTKQLFESYNIVESFEQMQVSETISHAIKEGTQSSDNDIHCSSSTIGTQKLKPKSMNIDCSSKVQRSVKEISKKSTPAPKTRPPVTNSKASSISSSDAMGQKTQKKYQRPNKENEKHKVKRQEKKFAPKEAGTVNSSVIEEPLEETKENMDAPQLKEISLIES